MAMMEIIESKTPPKALTGILERIEEPIMAELLQRDARLRVCGYGASMVTSVLQTSLPKSEVRLRYGYIKIPGRNNDGYTAPEIALQHHFWTEVDGEWVVDSTWGQFELGNTPRILLEQQARYHHSVAYVFDARNPHAFPNFDGGSDRLTREALIKNPETKWVPGLEYALGEKRTEFENFLKKLESIATPPQLTLKQRWLRFFQPRAMQGFKPRD